MKLHKNSKINDLVFRGSKIKSMTTKNSKTQLRYEIT